MLMNVLSKHIIYHIALVLQ